MAIPLIVPVVAGAVVFRKGLKRLLKGKKRVCRTKSGKRKVCPRRKRR